MNQDNGINDKPEACSDAYLMRQNWRSYALSDSGTTGINIFRVANGKIVEHWGNSDDLGMMQQMGVIPTMG